MGLINEHKYTYLTHWNAAEHAYIATVSEFPSLSWVDDNPATALAELHRVVREVLADMRRNGETPPLPAHLTR